MADEQIVAVALITRTQLDELGSSLQQFWLIDETPCFQGLLAAIDEAERNLWRSRDAQASGPSEGSESVRIASETAKPLLRG